MPTKCYSSVGVGFLVNICSRRTVVIRAFSTDTWRFIISGNVGNIREYKTVPGGTHDDSVAVMDINEHDYIQVYDLVN